jgi:probable addiction module antidote protein
VYLQQRGPRLVVLLIAGDKRTQAKDIECARAIAEKLERNDMAGSKRRKKSAFSNYDVADYLGSAEDVVEYLQACVDEAGDDSTLIAAALGDIARAKGMTELAQKTGLTREGLYKALAKDGNPSFATVMKVLSALDVKLVLHPN